MLWLYLPTHLQSLARLEIASPNTACWSFCLECLSPLPHLASTCHSPAQVQVFQKSLPGPVNVGHPPPPFCAPVMLLSSALITLHWNRLLMRLTSSDAEAVSSPPLPAAPRILYRPEAQSQGKKPESAALREARLCWYHGSVARYLRDPNACLNPSDAPLESRDNNAQLARLCEK